MSIAITASLGHSISDQRTLNACKTVTVLQLWQAQSGRQPPEAQDRGDPCRLRHAVLLLFGHAFGLRKPTILSHKSQSTMRSRLSILTRHRQLLSKQISIRYHCIRVTEEAWRLSTPHFGTALAPTELRGDLQACLSLPIIMITCCGCGIVHVRNETRSEHRKP
jgi:hypothetical protein